MSECYPCDEKFYRNVFAVNPSVDEIKAFHREISMMKAVGKHTNIVSIIGHCTKTCDHLYLLTEYCAKGSLLDFLR